MHNGVVADFISIAREMCDLMDDDAYANIQGSTDSEHFAALYITYLTDGKGKDSWEEQYPVTKMKEALQKTIESVVKLQRKKMGDKFQPSSLNIAATDGSQLATFRFRNHKTEQPPSLYYSTSAGVTMNRKYPDHPDGKENLQAFKSKKEHGRHIIVASEPSTYKASEWDLIEKNHCVLVGLDGFFRVEEVVYPGEWNAEAGTGPG